jgi:hypothetical protein
MIKIFFGLLTFADGIFDKIFVSGYHQKPAAFGAGV